MDYLKYGNTFALVFMQARAFQFLVSTEHVVRLHSEKTFIKDKVVWEAF